MALKADQTSGTGLVGKGDKYALLAAASVLQVKNAAGRICRILVTATGTGGVDVYDGTSTGAPHVYSKATVAQGDIYELDCPMTSGIYVVTGAAAAVTVIYT